MKKRKKIKVLPFVLCVSVVALFSFYLFFANSIAEDRFTLEEQDAKLAELRAVNSELALLASDEQSLLMLEARSRDLALEEIEHINYIEARAVSPLVLGN